MDKSVLGKEYRENCFYKDKGKKKIELLFPERQVVHVSRVHLRKTHNGRE